MPNQKISNLTPKGSALVATDLLEVSVYNGTTYDTRSVTGANVVSGLQPTLVSGTNIKTINSTSLLGSGDIAISTGLTVGTTPITSGTVGRVLFQGTGNVVQQDAGFLFDGTNKTLTNYGKGAVTSNISLGIGVFQNGTGAGTQNTAIGWGTANYLTSGSNNTMVGYRAGGGLLASNFTGNANTLIGSTAGLYLSSGIQNTFIGTSTGTSVTTGSYNTIIGHYTQSLAAGLAQNVILSDGASQVALWMNGSQRVGFGYNPLTDSLGAKVDIKAQGALSTDIAFRVRNSADSADILTVQGDATVNAKTKLTCGTSGMTTTGGALHIYAGNSSDYVSRWFNTAGNEIVGIRTVSNGGKLTLSSSSGVAGVTLDGQNSNALTLGAGRDIWFDTATGTKIGAATNQKLAFWNATPIVQPTTAVAAATVVSGAGGTVKHDDTFDGYTLQQVVKALRNSGLLA